MGPGWMIDVVGIGEALRQRFVPANSFTNVLSKVKLVKRSFLSRVPPGLRLPPPTRAFPILRLATAI